MTKREAIWVVWGLGLGAAAYLVTIFGFRRHAGDGRLVVVTLLGGAVAYLASIARIRKPKVQ